MQGELLELLICSCEIFHKDLDVYNFTILKDMTPKFGDFTNFIGALSSIS